jgi:hypothetical protein
MGFRLSVYPEPVRQIGPEVRAPLHRGSRHVKPVEDPDLHLPPDVEPQRLLEHELSDIEAFTGVARTRIGRCLVDGIGWS